MWHSVKGQRFTSPQPRVASALHYSRARLTFIKRKCPIEKPQILTDKNNFKITKILFFINIPSLTNLLKVYANIISSILHFTGICIETTAISNTCAIQKCYSFKFQIAPSIPNCVKFSQFVPVLLKVMYKIKIFKKRVFNCSRKMRWNHMQCIITLYKAELCCEQLILT